MKYLAKDEKDRDALETKDDPTYKQYYSGNFDLQAVL